MRPHARIFERQRIGFGSHLVVVDDDDRKRPLFCDVTALQPGAELNHVEWGEEDRLNTRSRSRQPEVEAGLIAEKNDLAPQCKLAGQLEFRIEGGADQRRNPLAPRLAFSPVSRPIAQP